MKKKVLFVCIHNSARSQMAEELLRKKAGDKFETESAGLNPGGLYPPVVQILKEDEDIDITGKKTQAVQDIIDSGKQYDYVITVCDEASAEKCPHFPGQGQRLHWGFQDPSSFTGDDFFSQTRAIKTEIESKIQEWLQSF